MNNTHTYFENLSLLIPDIPADSIISRTIFQDGQIKVVLFGFAQGQELSEHTASQPAVLLFISGEADLKLGEERLRAVPGSFVHMPARLPHSVRARTSVVMLLLLLQTPEQLSDSLAGK